jgi:DNA polymerase alpha subunit A
MPSLKKAAALRDIMREAREKADIGVSRMDEFEVEEQDDVYEYVEEEEYRKLVESTRQREDFVVDDGTYIIYYTERV